MTIVKTDDGQEFYLDETLKQNLDIAKANIIKDMDFIFLCDGNERCLSGDTIIRTSRNTLGRKFSLKNMYNQYHNNIDGIKRMKGWNLESPTFVRSYDGNTTMLHKIKDVVYSGKQIVYRLELENGFNIKATAEHLFLSSIGWKRLKDLNSDNFVMCDNPKAQKKNGGFRHLRHSIQIGRLTYHPCGQKRIMIHKLIYEANLNALEFYKFLDILCSEPEIAKGLKYIEEDKYVVHHKDFNHYNNNIENLELMSREKHLELHNAFAYKNFNQGIPFFSKVKSVNLIGEEDTYDIVCDEPNHNFNANDIIVHNSGKSVCIQKIAKYCDNSLCLDRITFTPKEFTKAVINAQPYQAVIYDEAYGGLSSRGFMTQINKALVSMLAEIGQKNLFIFVVLPSFYDADRYIALWRSRALIHTYFGDDFERGFFKFYNMETKKKLYVEGKKFYNYFCVRANFSGRFTNQYVVDEKAYREKKYLALRTKLPDEEKDIFPTIPHRLVENTLLELVVTKGKEVGLSQEQMASILNMNLNTFYKRLKKFKQNLLIQNDIETNGKLPQIKL